MSDEITLVPVLTEEPTSNEVIAEAVAEAVAETLQNEEDETQWVKDLFLSEFAPVKAELQNLTQLISQVLNRVPSQETFQTMQESLTMMNVKVLEIAALSTLTPPIIAEPIPESIPEPVAVAVDPQEAERPVEKAPPKRRRL